MIGPNDPGVGHVFETMNGGTSWSDISGNRTRHPPAAPPSADADLQMACRHSQPDCPESNGDEFDLPGQHNRKCHQPTPAPAEKGLNCIQQSRKSFPQVAGWELDGCILVS
jgi:hypothetical protein